MTKKKKRSLADELRTYGERSLDGLNRGADELGELARAILAQVPRPVDEVADFLASDLPGAGTRESMQLGGDAGRLWSEGNYGDSLIKMGQAIDAPLKDFWWLIPGGGLIPRAMK